jgi:hypothetical protein
MNDVTISVGPDRWGELEIVVVHTPERRLGP